MASTPTAVPELIESMNATLEKRWAGGRSDYHQFTHLAQQTAAGRAGCAAGRGVRSSGQTAD